jgi:hypothetical protein
MRMNLLCRLIRSDESRSLCNGVSAGYAIIANRRFTDLFEWGQRSVPLSLAAEIQHRLLPGSYSLPGRPVHARGLARTFG